MSYNKYDYTHTALAYGIVPVYMDMTTPDSPLVEVRHWSLEPLLDICEFFYGILVQIRLMMDIEYEPVYPFTITGEIEQDAKR